MAQGSEIRRQLEQHYRTHKEAPVPRGVPRTLIGDVDIDLYEEDSYLAGLTETFLKKGRLAIDAIDIDKSIDARLANAVAQSKNSPNELNRFIRYRSRMRRLAELLGQASGIPVTYRNKSEL